MTSCCPRPTAGSLLSRDVLVRAVAAAAVLSGGCGDRRPRALESSAIGDVRSVASAEAYYEARLGAGYYDKLECLVEPGDCLLGHPEDSPRILDERYLRHDRGDYSFTFHPGRAAPPGLTQLPVFSASLIDRWAYVAVPRTSHRGRGFCGDARGLICATLEGQTPRVEGGLCATSDEAEPRCHVLDR